MLLTARMYQWPTSVVVKMWFSNSLNQHFWAKCQHFYQIRGELPLKDENDDKNDDKMLTFFGKTSTTNVL